MSIIGIALNLLLAVLLLAALVMGWHLNKRLQALRDSHEGFAKAVAELDIAAARAEQGLADLRAATDEATDTLADRIEKARALTTRLDRQLQGAPVLTPVAVARSDRPTEAEDTGADFERVTKRLGSLLSEARTPRSRPEPELVLHRAQVAPRHMPEFDDDLFETVADQEPVPRRRVGQGGR